MSELKIYLLKQDENRGYNCYHSCVVCAKDEDDAKSILPDGGDFFDEEDRKYDDTWVKDINLVICTEIGIANKNQERGVLIADFSGE